METGFMLWKDYTQNPLKIGRLAQPRNEHLRALATPRKFKSAQ